MTSAAVNIFKNSRHTYITDYAFPIHWVNQVAKGVWPNFFEANVFIGQGNSPWSGHAQLVNQGDTIEFAVGRPDKWVVDDVTVLQGGIFKVNAVIRGFVGDAVDNDVVWTIFVHKCAANLNQFSHNTLIGFVYGL